MDWGKGLAGAGQWSWRSLVLIILGWLMVASAGGELEPADRVRRYTRRVEFDFVSWTLEALSEKLLKVGAGAPDYLNEAQRKALVLDYTGMIDQAGRLRQQFQEALSDPHAADPQQAAAPAPVELERVQDEQAGTSPLAAAV